MPFKAVLLNFLRCPTMVGDIKDQFYAYFSQENLLIIFEKINRTLSYLQIFVQLLQLNLLWGNWETSFFVQASDYLGITPLTQKQVPNPKKPAIMNHYFLEDHNATYNDFIIFIPKNNGFKSQFESLLVKRDKSKLNRNIYTHPTELFA